MARRTYLQRMAEPLRAGDPVLFAVPRAPADEARPALTPATTPALSRGAAPVPRRGRVSEPIAQPPASIALRAAAEPGYIPRIPVPEVTAPQVQPQSRPRNEPRQQEALPDRVPPATSAEPPQVNPAAPTRRFSEPTVPVTRREAASAPSNRAVETTVLDAPTARPRPSQHAAQPPAKVQDPVRPEQRGPAAAAVHESAPAPRLHIGTIEVRAAAPPPSPMPQQATRGAPPRHDSVPLSRAYAWRFGLVQG
jgi:hypothetical protein